MRSVDADVGPDEAYQQLNVHICYIPVASVLTHTPPPLPPPPSTKLESIAATLRDSSATKLEKKGRTEREKEEEKSLFCMAVGTGPELQWREYLQL